MFGDVPESVTKLTNLVHVDLSTNNFRGDVPIFTSSQLQVVNLSHNSLSGSLPQDFGSRMATADNLKVFDLKFNRIRGSIPASVGDLTDKLVELDLSSNRLYGECQSLSRIANYDHACAAGFFKCSL
jgi:Leucine-rich repeat (LRR) protein